MKQVEGQFCDDIVFLISKGGPMNHADRVSITMCCCSYEHEPELNIDYHLDQQNLAPFRPKRITHQLFPACPFFDSPQFFFVE
jgi:hypothetical protein